MRYVLDYVSEKLLCAFFVIIIISCTQPVTCKVDFEITAEDFGQICVSDECVKISAALKSSIDPSVNPCDDFYQFSCGKWLQTHDKSSVTTEAENILNSRIKNMLSNLKTDDELIKKVQTLYKSCNDGVVYESPGFEVCTQFLNENGLPTVPRIFTGDSDKEGFKWIKSEIKFQKLFGDGAFLSFVPDVYASNRLVMTVKYSKRYPNYKNDQYFGPSAIQGYLNSVSEKRELNEIKRALRLLKRLKKKLNNVTPGERVKTNYTIEYFEEWLTAAGIPISDTWKECISYMRNPDYLIYGEVLVDLQHVNAIFEQIDNSEADLIELFLWIKTMKTVKDEYAAISKPDASCSDAVRQNMGLVMVHGLKNEYLNDEARAEMKVMIKNILEVYAEVLERVYKDDVESANKKLRTLDLYLGYPDWISDSKKLEEYYEKLNFSRSDFKGNLLQLKLLVPKFEEIHEYLYYHNLMIINAYFYPSYNIIVIPIGTFTFPFYHLGLSFLNYGSIGTTAGHEIIHALDDIGDLSRYSPVVECIQKQYEEQYGVSMSEAALKEAENLADTGSIYLSFEAYRRYKDNTSLIEKKLVGFQEYTHEQMFFITYANQWCGDEEDYSMDPHSSNSYRTISGLKNSIEFSEAFNCPLGSEMNTGRVRCTLF